MKRKKQRNKISNNTAIKEMELASNRRKGERAQ